MPDYYHIKIEFDFFDKTLIIHSEKTGDVYEFKIVFDRNGNLNYPPIIQRCIFTRVVVKPKKGDINTYYTGKYVRTTISKSDAKELLRFYKEQNDDRK